ncbi:MAG TPA: cytochrome c oxidase assembly protein [Solirubrobacteraceae bacterium]|nr:cytochrome c oxidase assembly protein [Solirubrobacteraceae bacterium]
MRPPGLAQLIVGHWDLAWRFDIPAVVAVAAYLWAARLNRGRWPLHRTACWVGGVAALLIAVQSGIDAYDGELLSIHMVQHLLLLVVAPLLLLGGQPVMLALRALPAPQGRVLVRVLVRLRPVAGPWTCLALFWAAIALTHLPAFYDATLHSGVLHSAEHSLYLLAGLLLWWHVLGADPLPSHRLAGLPRLVYVLAAMLPMTIVGSLLDRDSTLVYPGYAQPARGLHVSALADQATAGAIMWVAGGTIMVAVALWAAMAGMAAEERALQRREAHATQLTVGLERTEVTR